MLLTDANVAGSRWISESFAVAQLLVGDRPRAVDAAQLLHELDQRRVGLVADDVAAGAEGPGPLPKPKLELTP